MSIIPSLAAWCSECVSRRGQLRAARISGRGAVRIYGTRTRQLTAIIEREEDGYVALCPDLDIASQGESVERARANLIEALELFFESADRNEVDRRLHKEVFITQVEVLVGSAAPTLRP